MTEDVTGGRQAAAFSLGAFDEFRKLVLTKPSSASMMSPLLTPMKINQHNGGDHSMQVIRPPSNGIRLH